MTRLGLLGVAVAGLSVVAGCGALRVIAGAPPRTATHPTTLLASRCGSCHAVPDPASMGREQWLTALDRMKRRMTLRTSEWDSLAALAAPQGGVSR